VSFTTAGVGFALLSKAGFDPIPATEGGLTLPPDAPQYFSKSPLHLKSGVAWAEITAVQGDITFAWVPAGVWTGSPGWSLAPYLAATARFESCGGSYTGFLGGVLTPKSRECVTLDIRSNLRPEGERVRVPIGRDACT